VPPDIGPKSISGVFVLTKYSKEFKLKVVQDYLMSTMGLRLIAKKYGVKAIPTYFFGFNV
jgi:transposase-like protein